MKVRTLCACMSTALLISFSTSNVFADVSQVTDRGDLINSDSIFWDTQGTVLYPLPDYYAFLVGSSLPASPNVFAINGTAAAVSQNNDPEFEIYNEPSIYFERASNFSNGDYLLSTFAFTNGNNNFQNPVTFAFSDSNLEEVCGFGTQIAPAEVGGFNAEIQAFDGNGAMGVPFVVTGSDQDANAAFMGLSSTTPMTSVQIVVTSTGDGGGSVASWYAINQVTLTYCSDLPVDPPEPEVPTMSCSGFAAPMANHPVKAKKNRVFPLKMELFDADGFEQTDVELSAAPVVTVMFESSAGGDAVDVSDEALSSGHGSDGNLFEYTDDGIWQFNLKSKNYTSSGTYYVTVDSGDELEYVIEEPSCVTSFIIK